MARGKAKASENNGGGSAKKTSKVSACAMGPELCKKPDGKISWVCCDGCEAWYHCNCVSVNPKLAAEMVFHCSTCKPVKEQVRTAKFSSSFKRQVYNFDLI